MNRNKRILFIILACVFAISACSAPPAQPTQIGEAAFTQPVGDLPASDADVPRVSLEEAKAALDSDAAVIVDVRSAEAYEASHVAGAISVPLEEIMADPASLNLDKHEWIITYCT